MDPLDLGEPLRGCRDSLRADGGYLIAQSFDLPLQPFHQRAYRPRSTDRHESEDRRVADRPAPGRLAAAQDHQPCQLGHHGGVGVTGLEKHVLGDREHFGIAQGIDVGGMRHPRNQRHFARRLAGPDDAQKVRLLAVLTTERAEAARAHNEQLVRDVAMPEQLLTTRHREPDGLGLDARVPEQSRQHRISGDFRQFRHAREPSPLWPRRLRPWWAFLGTARALCGSHGSTHDQAGGRRVDN